jgi:hypothetical protein
VPTVRGTTVIRLNVRGAGRAAKDLDRAARGIQDDINAELRELGMWAEAIYMDEAPHDTGQIRGNVRAVPYFRTVRPRLRVVVEPLDGHGGDGRDYLGVTRRGHRKARIYPRAAKALKVHLMGHRNPHMYVFRASVEGVGHGGSKVMDWVSRAGPRIDRAERHAEQRLGRRIQRRMR